MLVEQLEGIGDYFETALAQIPPWPEWAAARDIPDFPSSIYSLGFIVVVVVDANGRRRGVFFSASPKHHNHWHDNGLGACHHWPSCTRRLDVPRIEDSNSDHRSFCRA